ncbi:hypothetical protein F5876DRAFT_1556, partial [Lentinula aff. lateritia]
IDDVVSMSVSYPWDAQTYSLFDLQLPKMNPFPLDNSVLILDNCAIHKTRAIKDIIE